MDGASPWGDEKYEPLYRLCRQLVRLKNQFEREPLLLQITAEYLALERDGAPHDELAGKYLEFLTS